MDGLAWRMRGPLQEVGLTGKTLVLKGKVQSWLIQKQEVLAFVQARPAHGGQGRWWCCLRRVSLTLYLGAASALFD
jgi:hypothetical protein